MSAPHKPLSALLSQILVAYSVELDCDFERRMLQTQSRCARLSLVIWLNLLQFLADGPVSVRTLASRALTAEAGVTAALGCLERWGVVALQPGMRAGFGGGRGIRADWPVRLTASGESEPPATAHSRMAVSSGSFLTRAIFRVDSHAW